MDRKAEIAVLRLRLKELEEAAGLEMSADQEEASSEALVTESKKLPFHSELYGSSEIMSVDDNVVNHMVVENSLEPRGFKVTVCMSGPEALELIETRGFLPDLILLDCMMPEMTGYEMCEQLRLSFPCNCLPVIMVSAKNQEQDVVKGLTSGCNDYLTKPFGVQELNARIDVQLKLKQLWYLEIQRLMAERPELLNLPEKVQRRWSGGEKSMLDVHESVTVLVCDLVQIMEHLQTLPAEQLSKVIHQVFDGFDGIVSKHHATRIMDDCYMVILGDDLSKREAEEEEEEEYGCEPPEPHQDQQEQARTMLKMAAEMVEQAQSITATYNGQTVHPWVRIGIARGRAHSALIGMKMKYYTYFGEAVSGACDACASRPTLSSSSSAASAAAKHIYITKEIASLVGAQHPDLTLCAITNPAPRSGSPSSPPRSLSPSSPSRLRVPPLSTSSPLASVASASALASTQNDASACYMRAFLRMSAGIKFDRRVSVDHSSPLLASPPPPPTPDDDPSALAALAAFQGTDFSPDPEVLVVDPSPVDRMLIENALAPSAYKVWAADSGEEALSRLRDRMSLPHVVLVEQSLPGMTGLELCCRLRAEYPLMAMSVLLTSAHLSTQLLCDGMAAGCNGFIPKPLVRMELLAHVQIQMHAAEAARKALNMSSFERTCSAGQGGGGS